MAGKLPSLRSHPAVIASVVAAAVAVTAFALVGIAYLLGWVPSKANVPTPGSIATPGQQVAGSAPGVALLPGETLVEPEAPKPVPGPVTPSYSQTRPPIANPAVSKKPAAAPLSGNPRVKWPQPSTPAFAKTLPSRAAPSAPRYLPDEPAAPRSNERSIRGVCVNCGSVASIGSYGNDWEVRVRFEDGSSQIIRYPERPRLRIGERVRLEDGRLIAE